MQKQRPMKVMDDDGDEPGKSPDEWYEAAFAIGVELGPRLVPPDDADDLAGTLARRLHRQIMRGESPPGDLRGWVARGLLRAAARYRKAERSRARKFQRYEFKRAKVQREWMHPEAAFDLDEQQDDVRSALDELSEMQLKVLTLIRVNRLTYKEVAQELGIDLGTVRTHKDRAIRKLKRALLPRRKETT